MSRDLKESYFYTQISFCTVDGSKQQHYYYCLFFLQNCVQTILVHKEPPLSIFSSELPEIEFYFIVRSDSIVGWYVAVTFAHSTVLNSTKKIDAKTLHILSHIQLALTVLPWERNWLLPSTPLFVAEC
jgi:hypothetical protein